MVDVGQETQAGYSVYTGEKSASSHTEEQGGVPLGGGPPRKHTTSPKVTTFDELCNPTDKQKLFLSAIQEKKYVLYGGAAGGGKALDITTKIPVVNRGFVEMKNVHPGDLVLNSKGYPVLVIAETEILLGRPCYKIVFKASSDRVEVIADEDHLWRIDDFLGTQIVTSKNLAQKILNQEIFVNGFRRWTVESCEPNYSVPVKCIEVDSKDGMYCCTESFIPTHNSRILRWGLLFKLLRWAQAGHNNVRVGMFCEDYPSLRERQLTKVAIEFPPWLGTLKESLHEFQLNEKFGSGVIAFRNLDEVSRYASSEFAAIGVDELTKNEMDVFNQLRWRMRWPGIEDHCFMAATNPGSKGHLWVRQLWVDRVFPPEMEEYADDFVFVQAKVEDNPHLPKNYANMLSSLPEQMRKAFAEGSWDIYEGQCFSDWSASKHIVEPFQIPSGWTKIVAMDWGFSKPYAIYWGAVDYDGRIWIYREMYGCRNNTPNVGSQETAREVAIRMKHLQTGEDISYLVADPACWSKLGTGPSIAEEFMMTGIYFTQADNARLAGKMQMHMRLRDNSIKFFRTCTHAIRTIPALVYDQHKTEDVDTSQEDHCLAGDTLVITVRGEIPISEVVVGDFILNRYGWFRVLAAGITNHAATVRKVFLSNGKTITGTGNHKLITHRGPTEIDALRYGDIIMAVNDRVEVLSLWNVAWRLSLSMASSTVGILTRKTIDTSSAQERIRRRGLLPCIETFGYSITVPFLKAITYIMALAATPITRLRIWSASLDETTYPSTSKQILRDQNTWHGYGPLLLSGISLKRVISGIALMPRKALARLSRGNSFASSAARALWQDRTGKTGSAATTASLPTEEQAASTMRSEYACAVKNSSPVTSTVTSATALDPVRAVAIFTEYKVPVYNLHVDVVHEYIANGVCSSNSYDAIRYLLQSRPWTPAPEINPADVEAEFQKKIYSGKKNKDLVSGGTWMSA